MLCPRQISSSPPLFAFTAEPEFPLFEALVPSVGWQLFVMWWLLPWLVWIREKKRQQYWNWVFRVCACLRAYHFVVAFVRWRSLMVDIGKGRSWRWASVYVRRSWIRWTPRASNAAYRMLIHHWVTYSRKNITQRLGAFMNAEQEYKSIRIRKIIL